MKRAEVDIRELLRNDTARAWTIREVQDHIADWRGTIASLALMDMRRRGEIEIGNDLGLRVLELHTD